MNALNKLCEVIKHQVHSHMAFVFTVLQCSASLWEAPGHMPSEVLLKDLGPFCFICLYLSVYCLDPFHSWEHFFFRCVYSVLLRVEEENKSECPLSSSSSSCLSTADRLGGGSLHPEVPNAEPIQWLFLSCSWSSHEACLSWNWNKSIKSVWWIWFPLLY